MQHYSLVLLCFDYRVLTCCQMELLASTGRLSLCSFHGVCPAHERPAVGLNGGEVPWIYKKARYDQSCFGCLVASKPKPR